MFWRPALASVPTYFQHSSTPVLLVPAHLPINLPFIYLFVYLAWGVGWISPLCDINDRENRWKKSGNWTLYLNSSTEAGCETVLSHSCKVGNNLLRQLMPLISLPNAAGNKTNSFKHSSQSLRNLSAEEWFCQKWSAQHWERHLPVNQTKNVDNPFGQKAKMTSQLRSWRISYFKQRLQQICNRIFLIWLSNTLSQEIQILSPNAIGEWREPLLFWC